MTFCNPACHPLSDSQRLLPWNSVGPGLCSCRKKHPAACLLVVLLNHLGLPFESLQPQRKFRGKSLKVSHLGFHVSWGRFHVSWGRPRPVKLLEQKKHGTKKHQTVLPCFKSLRQWGIRQQHASGNTSIQSTPYAGMATLRTKL